MKKFLVLSLLASAVFLSACDDRRSFNTKLFDNYEHDIVNEKDTEEEVKNAEPKPLRFYQRLLEEFCQKYYDDCFSGRTYHQGSVVADRMNVVDAFRSDGTSVIDPSKGYGDVVRWTIYVEGKHSFEGFKNYNDSPFEANIIDYCDNSYEIKFEIKRYDVFGDQMSDREYATRTMTYYE